MLIQLLLNYVLLLSIIWLSTFFHELGHIICLIIFNINSKPVKHLKLYVYGAYGVTISELFNKH